MEKVWRIKLCLVTKFDRVWLPNISSLDRALGEHLTREEKVNCVVFEHKTVLS